MADRVKRSDDDLPVYYKLLFAKETKFGESSENSVMPCRPFASLQKREASTSESAESQLRVEREVVELQCISMRFLRIQGSAS